MEKVWVQIPVWPATQIFLVAYSSGSAKSHCRKCTVQRRPTSWVSRLYWDCELGYCESVLDRVHELPTVRVYVHPLCRMMQEELNFLPRFLTLCHSWLTMLPSMQLQTRCWHEYTVNEQIHYVRCYDYVADGCILCPWLLAALLNFKSVKDAISCHNWLFAILITGEQQLSINDGGAKWKGGKVQESVTLGVDSKVRLLRHGIIRY